MSSSPTSRQRSPTAARRSAVGEKSLDLATLQALSSRMGRERWRVLSDAAQVVANYPVEVDRLTQDEKMEIMDILNRKGVFLLKGSVSHVAQTLHSSEASIYRYLGKLNNK